MNQPCPNCGNRQHLPNTKICQVCGQPLSNAIEESFSEQSPASARCLPTGRQQNLPAPLNPCLTDQNSRQYAIDPNRETYIGSLSSADICIQGPDIKPRHAHLFSSDEKIFLEAMVGCLVLVNGRALGRSARMLCDRDRITLGSSQVLLYQANVPMQQQAPQRSHSATTNSNDITVASPISSQTQPYRAQPAACDLYGHVRHIDGPYLEPPDPNLGRALANTAGFLLALWKPAFIMIQEPHKQVPARYLRVEMLDRQVRIVKMKGNLVRGTLNLGDAVLFWGEWQNGTLLMHRGYNETAQADIFLKQ